MNKYNLDKAVQKLSWRFNSNKAFKPNENDIEALNTIFEWINRQKKETLNNNVILAKLYIYHKTMNIRKYETTVLDKFHVVDNDMIKLFKTPLEVFYKAFHQDIHHNQLNKLVKFEEINKQIDEDIKNAETNYPDYEGITSKEDYIKHKESKKYTVSQQEDLVKGVAQLQKTYTLKYVSDKLADEITEVLNNY